MKKILKWMFMYLLIVVFLSVFVHQMQKDNVLYPSYEIKDSVDILYNEEEIKDIDLSTYQFSGLSAGDYLELYFEVEDLGLEQPMIAFLTYHCNVKAYDNGQLMYEYGSNDMEGKKMAPSGIHMIPLLKEESHRIRICLEILEDNPFTSIDKLEIHESSTYFKEFLRENVLNVIIGVFMISLGILFPLILIAVGKIGGEYRKALWLSGFCILAGLWMECDINLMQFYIEDLYLVSELKYFSLYTCIIPLLMFCQETFHNKKKKKIIKISAIVSTIVCAIVILQHFMGWITFATNLINYQLMALILVGIVFIIAISECMGEESSERVFCQGICFLCCSICLELLRFNVAKYFFANTNFLKFSLVYFGFLIFILVMLRSYFISLIEHMSERQKQEVLRKMSCVDILTDVANRTQCNKEIEELKEKGQKDFTVILFDLNYLKHINERFGHEMGDGYIYEFAQILKYSFEDCYLLGRMGGDEFMVVLEKDDMGREKEYLDKVQAYTEEYNVDKDKAIRISYAVGSASSTSREPMDFWAVYDLADDRMHECKKRVKANK